MRPSATSVFGLAGEQIVPGLLLVTVYKIEGVHKKPGTETEKIDPYVLLQAALLVLKYLLYLD